MSLLLTLLIGYLIALLTLRMFESHLLFFPDYPGRLEGDWHPRTLPVEDVWLKSADGTKLHAWWIPNKEAKFTFLAFHGNASNIANRASVYEFLRDTPANVFALEYRGYGHSEGKQSESGIYLDAEAAHQYLVDVQKIDPKAIISFGQSLGTAVAANLAPIAGRCGRSGSALSFSIGRGEQSFLVSSRHSVLRSRATQHCRSATTYRSPSPGCALHAGSGDSVRVWASGLRSSARIKTLSQN